MKAIVFMSALWLVAMLCANAEPRKIGQDMEKTSPEPTADYIAILDQGRKLYADGKLEAALQQVEVVLAKYPHYGPAVQLRTVLTRAIINDGSRVVRARLERIVIPRVNFRDARVESALDFLRDETRRLDQEGKGVNFVPLLPDEVRKRKITLDLIDARASEVLDYIAEAAGLRYRLDRSAVVLTPREGTAQTQTAATQPGPSAPIEPPVPELPTIPGAP
jgi:hypothetical protein